MMPTSQYYRIYLSHTILKYLVKTNMCYHVCVCVCVCEYLKNWLIHIDDLIDYLIVDVLSHTWILHFNLPQRACISRPTKYDYGMLMYHVCNQSAIFSGLYPINAFQGE